MGGNSLLILYTTQIERFFDIVILWLDSRIKYGTGSESSSLWEKAGFPDQVGE